MKFNYIYISHCIPWNIPLHPCTHDIPPKKYDISKKKSLMVYHIPHFLGIYGYFMDISHPMTSHEIYINPAFFLLHHHGLPYPPWKILMISHLALRGDQQIFPGVPGRRNTMRIQKWSHGREKIRDPKCHSFIQQYTTLHLIKRDSNHGLC